MNRWHLLKQTHLAWHQRYFHFINEHALNSTEYRRQTQKNSSHLDMAQMH